MPNPQSPTPQQLLAAYAQGIFPMAESRHAKELHWFSPKKRAIIPITPAQVPASLKKLAKKTALRLSVSEAFPDVIRACADMRTETRQDSWINDQIIALYTELWRLGFAHSVECWKEDVLVGGLYGLSIGGAFFGESMFSKTPNASKLAMLHLLARLNACGYSLLDAQYANPHLVQFGMREILRADYLTRLDAALNASPNPSSRFLTVSLISPFTLGES